jgi:hypothetical protein
MDPTSAIGVAAAAAQFAALAFSVSNTLKQYLQDIKDAPKRSRELKGELLLVSDVLEDLKSVVTNVSPDVLPANPLLTGAINEFAELIKEIAHSIEVKKKDIKKRLKWPFTEKENEKYLSRLERFKSTFNLACDALQSYLAVSKNLE